MKKETPTVQKDEGKISISTKNKCIIGDQKANVNASITGNALNKTITWTTSKCYSMQKVSGTSINVYRNNTNGCNANDTFKVNAKLNNGSNSSVSITYEPQLTYKVYDRLMEMLLLNLLDKVVILQQIQFIYLVQWEQL